MGLLLGLLLLAHPRPSHAATLEQLRDYDFPSALQSAAAAERVVWLSAHRGRRNVWVAEGPHFTPRKLTDFLLDDGQDMSGLQVSANGRTVVFVRGGEHTSNWERDVPVNVSSMPEGPKVEVWAAPFSGGHPVLLGEGDGATVSADGNAVAYIHQGAVYRAAADGRGTPERLFSTRGSISSLTWSPQGDRLAFVVDRGSHAMIGVFTAVDHPLLWMAPAVAKDSLPRWSPDGSRLLFARRMTGDGAPRSFVPRPWSIWVADAATGVGAPRWHSGWQVRDSLPGGLPAMFDWAANGSIVFLSYQDGWMHLYALDHGADEARLLTPGDFQVEQAVLSGDRRSVIYSANSGADPDDVDRRHLFRVELDGSPPIALTAGTGSEWSPASTPAGRLLFLGATAQRPPLPSLLAPDGQVRRLRGVPADYPVAELVVPRRVQFHAEDGTLVYGQLFEPPAGAAHGKHPAVVFAHGGPQRQMLLTWHYGGYYANAYAINQYLAMQGVTVLAVNYRLGPFYGHDFHYPPDAGVAGGAEYRDIRAAGRFLQTLPDVDRERIGIYGGSYGGYLTAMALAHDSGLFKVGVDVHGVHDWTAPEYAHIYSPRHYPDAAAADRAREVAWRASPQSAVSGWTSPVLLIHGDDDRNVRFSQTVDLVHRLRTQGVPHETLMIVDDTHHMLRYGNELRVNAAIADYLLRQFGEE